MNNIKLMGSTENEKRYEVIIRGEVFSATIIDGELISVDKVLKPETSSRKSGSVEFG